MSNLSTLREAIWQRFPHALVQLSATSAMEAVEVKQERNIPDSANPWQSLLPRGRLEGGLHLLLRGGPSSGKTSLAISLAARSSLEGNRVAWIDGPKTFFPPIAAQAGIDLSALLVVRPPSLVAALRATVPLLECGGFGVIILDLSSFGNILKSRSHRLKRRQNNTDSPVVASSRRVLLALRGANGALIVISESDRPLPIAPMLAISLENPRPTWQSSSIGKSHANLVGLTSNIQSRSRAGKVSPQLHGCFGNHRKESEN